MAEPGGAVGLATALKRNDLVRGRTTVVVVSGGNVDPEDYARFVGVGARGLDGLALAALQIQRGKAPELASILAHG